jgi:hypothetical protein
LVFVSDICLKSKLIPGVAVQHNILIFPVDIQQYVVIFSVLKSTIEFMLFLPLDYLACLCVCVLSALGAREKNNFTFLGLAYTIRQH